MIPSRFQFYCQHVLPLVYDESLSYYEVLCKLGEYIKDLTKDISSMEELVVALQSDYNELNAAFGNFQSETNLKFTSIKDQLEADYNDLQDQINALKSGLTPGQSAFMTQWLQQNLASFIPSIVKYVVFGLDNQGYFVAYIPPSWDFIEFGTVEETNSPLFGHLTLNW